MRLDTQQLAWLVLEMLHRTQGKDTTVPLVDPRNPEVAHQLDQTLVADKLPAAEAYLLERGYIAPTNLGLTWGTYTITPRGWSGARRVCRTKRQHWMRPVGVGLKKSVTWST